MSTGIVGTPTQREEHKYGEKDNDSYREPPEIHTPHIAQSGRACNGIMLIT